MKGKLFGKPQFVTALGRETGSPMTVIVQVPS
jgi:hypothetical protein